MVDYILEVGLMGLGSAPQQQSFFDVADGLCTAIRDYVARTERSVEAMIGPWPGQPEGPLGGGVPGSLTALHLERLTNLRERLAAIATQLESLAGADGKARMAETAGTVKQRW